MSRLLVTLHYPLDMHLVGVILSEVAKAYPEAVVGQNGTVWDGPTTGGSETTARVVTHFDEAVAK